MMTPQCSISGCPSPHKAKGFCATHYYQQRDAARADAAAADRRCHYCRQPSEGKYTCSVCAKKKTEYAKKRREQASLRGMCYYAACPSKSLQGDTLCPTHRAQVDGYAVAHKDDYKHAPHSPERTTITRHLHLISRGVSTYAGMPFFDGWNSKQGGSLDAGENWIVDNIGRKPGKEYDLHIVDRRIGFMPGNLVWVPRDKHRREELIWKLMLEVKTLQNLLDKKSGSL